MCFPRRCIITSEAEAAFVDISPNPSSQFYCNICLTYIRAILTTYYLAFIFMKTNNKTLFIMAVTCSMNSQSHMFSSPILISVNMLESSLVKVQWKKQPTVLVLHIQPNTLRFLLSCNSIVIYYSHCMYHGCTREREHAKIAICENLNYGQV